MNILNKLRYDFKIEDENEIRESIKKGNWIKAIKQCYKYNLLDINLDLLGLENILFRLF
ncbi:MULTISPECIES: hypothetical protein [Clostridium]|uniref:hypothetical protein n=1 Tax=Clostridium TaxID=1485 RepID=UPI001FAE5151|nr:MULTISPECIES: hypothetical protein [Clostridium]MCW6090306.1 hypothetical protein [Clostridium sporogenes]MDU7253329.1 hypothetical protein [Clostridium sp.]